MPVKTEVTQTMYECPICHNLYETEGPAKQCEDCGNHRNNFMSMFMPDELYWYLLHYDPAIDRSSNMPKKPRWALAKNLKPLKYSPNDYPYAKSTSCIHGRLTLVDVNNNEYLTSDMWRIERRVTLHDAFINYKIIPNYKNICDDMRYGKFTEQQQLQLIELWTSIAEYTSKAVNKFLATKMHRHVVNSILRSLIVWPELDTSTEHCGYYVNMREPEEISQEMADWCLFVKD